MVKENRRKKGCDVFEGVLMASGITGQKVLGSFGMSTIAGR